MREADRLMSQYPIVPTTLLNQTPGRKQPGHCRTSSVTAPQSSLLSLGAQPHSRALLDPVPWQPHPGSVHSHLTHRPSLSRSQTQLQGPSVLQWGLPLPALHPQWLICHFQRFQLTAPHLQHRAVSPRSGGNGFPPPLADDEFPRAPQGLPTVLARQTFACCLEKQMSRDEEPTLSSFIKKRGELAPKELSEQEPRD